MRNAKVTCFTIGLATDLADKVTKAAATAGVPVEAVISDCVSQQLETALCHRVLIQRQGDVDEALLELARLVGRLSASPGEPPESVCRYRTTNVT